jgi:putative transposon-encoded protein
MHEGIGIVPSYSLSVTPYKGLYTNQPIFYMGVHMAEFRVKGEQLMTKIVGKHGTGGIVYVPKAWIGRKVSVILEGE